MYRVHFGLKGVPFHNHIEPENLFMYQGLKEMYSRLDYLKELRGLMLLTGKSGVGKSVSLKVYKEKLKSDNFKVIYIPLSTVSNIEFYRQINDGLDAGFMFRKNDLFQSIQKSILNYVTNYNRTPVIILDEANYLRNENLHELCLLTNFNFDTKNPAIFILCGNTLLNERVLRPGFESLNRRFRIKYQIPPLTREETMQYIIHRLKQVGYNEPLCTEAAYDAVFKVTSGAMGIVNNLMEKALIFAAYKKLNSIDEEVIYQVQKEL